MSIINLVDDFGLSIGAIPATGSLWEKVKSLPTLHLLSGIEEALTEFNTGIDFNQQTPFTIGPVNLTNTAGACAKLSAIVGSGKRTSVFPDADKAEQVPLAVGDRWICFEMDAKAGISGTATGGDASFGLSVCANAKLANYLRVAPGDDVLKGAISDLIGGFTIPFEAAALWTLPAGRIVTIACDGALKLSGSVSFPVASNVLASVNLPAPVGAVQVKAGASVTASAGVTVSGGFEIRARQIAGGIYRFGIFKQRGTAWSVSVDAQAGTDLLSQVLGAVGTSAEKELTELQANMPAGTLSALQQTVKLGVDHNLKASLSLELSGLDETKAAFLFEVDPPRLDGDGTKAVTAALRGDLSGLTGTTVPTGITLLSRVRTHLDQTTHTFKVNLLGIYNAISVTKLALEGTILVDEEKGEITITDKITASTVKAATLNVPGQPNRADSHALRHALATSLLVTVAYRGSKTVEALPAITSNHTFFELHENTDTATMQQELATAVALGLMQLDDEAALLAQAPTGRTEASASASYDDAACHALFLKGGAARTAAEYEELGREALLPLLRPQDRNTAREAVLRDGALWTAMKQAQPDFQKVFPTLSTPDLQAIAADFVMIEWWAQTMSATASKLAELVAFVESHTGDGLQDAAFLALRDSFAKHLKDAAGKAHEEFGRPWGLVAMDLAAGRQGTASFSLAGPSITVARQRAIVQTA